MKSWFAPLFLFLPLFFASCVPSSLSNSDPVTSYANNTDIPENPTIIAKSPTPQNGVQEPTLVDVPFLSPTDIVPSLTPVTPEASPTATEMQPSATPTVSATPEASPTIIATEVEQEDWFDKHFLPEEKLPEGAILMNKLTLEQVQKLTITGPGQVYGRCHLKDAVKDYRERNKILSAVRIDLSEKNGNFCITQATSEKTMRNGISKKFPELSILEQEELINQYIQQAQNWMRRIADLPYEPMWDLFENFAFRYIYDENGIVSDVSLHIYDNPYPPTGEWPLREVIDIPLSTSTPTPTPFTFLTNKNRCFTM